jgi:hypothetical protein
MPHVLFQTDYPRREKRETEFRTSRPAERILSERRESVYFYHAGMKIKRKNIRVKGMNAFYLLEYSVKMSIFHQKGDTVDATGIAGTRGDYESDSDRTVATVLFRI